MVGGYGVPDVSPVEAFGWAYATPPRRGFVVQEVCAVSRRMDLIE